MVIRVQNSRCENKVQYLTSIICFIEQESTRQRFWKIFNGVRIIFILHLNGTNYIVRYDNMNQLHRSTDFLLVTIP
jgi:hypothetical protein